MNQILILFIFGVVSAVAEEEPFSIGLGVLSPSYTQTVGKENVKVQFDQKEDGGFSYSVGDPKSGTNTYLSFGESAAQRAAQAPTYNDAPNYAAPLSAPTYSSGPGYAAPSQPLYNGPSGYAAPAYNGFAGYQGHQSNNFYGNNGYEAAARKPEEPAGGILPAGFSYHATDGQAFLGSMGESPTFMVEDPESARRPAEDSFFNRGHGSHEKQGLVNGLVGFGPGGPRGGLPIGGYAGPQYQGAHREHGGHDE